MNTLLSVGETAVMWGVSTLVTTAKDMVLSLAKGLYDGVISVSIDIFEKLEDTAMGLFEDMAKGLGSLADGLTLDLFDFDQSGGESLLSGAGESFGLQGTDDLSGKPIPEANKVKILGLKGKIGPGTLFLNGVPVGIPIEVEFNGVRRTYIVCNLKRVNDSDAPQRRRGSGR